MVDEKEEIETEIQEWSLRRYNRAHVWRVYELCERDAPRAARLLDLTPDEVMIWVESEDGD